MSDWSEVVAGAIGGGLAWGLQILTSGYLDRRHRNKIFNWLQAESAKPGSFEFRSTKAISKAVSLPPERVYYLCHTDIRIHPALGDRDDLWNLSGEDQVKRNGLWG
ncbi:hypothetical protein M1M11_31450 [Pseudomonas azerbaijanoccidens]|uniref:hypothetical protein n=1 Tax=Pseudomonas azerbaijanoccidentalis TaxID=2842347 RepID=UPI00200A5818|nr:hypothetical protein [Pseudomonas azerbaijanoccidentalis]MCK8669402.1 hypothetical protein [Pseudomonas azerbaijanoccidentalis]